jgi:hypothetical protein
MTSAVRGAAGLLLLAVACAGCAGANGDFGRVKPGLVTDDVHAWVGSTAALGIGAPISNFLLTDDERLLRDLAYPLIESPLDRQRWYSVLKEYGIDRIFRHDWSAFDEQAYGRRLMSQPLRSESARYARLGDDIRNDRTRIPQFFAVAVRVLEADRNREAMLANTTSLPPREQLNAIARVGENALVISWVQWSLMARAVSYRYALDHLIVMSPMPAATDTDRSLTALQDLIERSRVLPGPDLAPGPGVPTVPPFEGPLLPAPPRRPLSVLGEAWPRQPPG